jgi:hypothetical protein
MKIKPGQVPPNRIGVYDHHGTLKGVCGPKATSVTAARFGVGHGAVLGRVGGRPAWIGQAPKTRPVQASSLPLAESLKAARGSNKRQRGGF